MNLSSGAEIVSRAREIAQHFATEGSPIMIGGDLYAHTIIGVEFNEEDEEKVRFLIVDPHYTGSDANGNRRSTAG